MTTRIPHLIASTVLLALLTGCATPAAVSNMSVYTTQRTAPAALKKAIAVADVTGGRETNPLWISQVSSQAFRSALEDSLANAGVFERVLSASKYRLTADLNQLEQPAFGIDMTVTSSIKYTVVDTKTGKNVYSRLISAPFTAGFSDSPLGATRVRIATEGSIKKNIELLINDLLITPERLATQRHFSCHEDFAMQQAENQYRQKQRVAGADRSDDWPRR